jgi:hypothetical protein
MQVYKMGENQIVIKGIAYTATADGVIDVPDKLASAAFAQGFVIATGRLAEVAKTSQVSQVLEVAKPEEIPLNKVVDEVAKKSEETALIKAGDKK